MIGRQNAYQILKKYYIHRKIFDRHSPVLEKIDNMYTSKCERFEEWKDAIREYCK